MQHRPRPAEGDDDDDDDERRRGQPADPPSPRSGAGRCPRSTRALAEQQRGDQEPAEGEEQRHPEEAAAHRVDPRRGQGVEAQDAGDGDAAQPVERRLVGQEPVLPPDRVEWGARCALEWLVRRGVAGAGFQSPATHSARVGRDDGRQQQDDDQEAPAVEVLEVAGPAGVDEEQVDGAGGTRRSRPSRAASTAATTAPDDAVVG